jgi:hypothetical protein
MEVEHIAQGISAQNMADFGAPCFPDTAVSAVVCSVRQPPVEAWFGAISRTHLPAAFAW